jgi:hypothetical protein
VRIPDDLRLVAFKSQRTDLGSIAKVNRVVGALSGTRTVYGWRDTIIAARWSRT